MSRMLLQYPREAAMTKEDLAQRFNSTKVEKSCPRLRMLGRKWHQYCIITDTGKVRSVRNSVSEANCGPAQSAEARTAELDEDKTHFGQNQLICDPAFVPKMFTNFLVRKEKVNTEFIPQSCYSLI